MASSEADAKLLVPLRSDGPEARPSFSEEIDEVTEDVRNRAVEGVESVDENGFNMDTGSDRLVAAIGQRVNVRLERGVVLAMHYVPIKFDRHQVLGRDVGVRDAVRRDHEAVLVGDPNAEVTLGVLHQTEGLGPLGNRHDLATYLNLRHRHDCCLLSRSFMSDRSSAGEQPLTKSCGGPEGSKSDA